MAKARVGLFSVLLIALCVLSQTAVWAQGTSADAIADVVANSGAFPAGTTVVSVVDDGVSVVVDLSPEAITSTFGDALADDMVEAITDALTPWESITSIEVTVAGLPLWQYLPVPSVPDASAGGATVQSVGSVQPFSTGVMGIDDGSVVPAGAPLSGELAGKNIALHPSHGSYWHQGYGRWFRAMRTFCGPNPASNLPPGWTGSRYQPSNYYFWSRGFQWGSFYEDDMSPETIRFLAKYIEAAGGTPWVSRNLDKNAGDFDYAAYGYPNSSFPLPKWQTAAKYYLQDRGDIPEWVWNEPSLSAESDKDLRARPYYANYRNCDLSFSLHSNAAGAGGARGTEAYYYNAKYPTQQVRSKELSITLDNAIVAGINNYFDDTYGKAMYYYLGYHVNPPEWPYGSAPYYPGYSSWYNRGGGKYSNFGEIREAQMPATLVEIAFHDDWKFFPDHVFMMDQIWRATAAWGIYQGMCQFFGVPARPVTDAEVVSVNFPALVGPNAPVEGTVTVKNLGMSWCWGDKWENMLYFPYTVWNLVATADEQFAPGTKIAIAQNAVVNPGDAYTFNVSLTSPATTALLNTSWQMAKDDAKGGAFGAVASAQVQVDADAPVISITSPTAGDYGRAGSVAIQFGATDALSGVASISATLDGAPVESGASFGLLWAGLGQHTLSVTAVDGVGNTATQTITFNVIATIESMIAAVNELYAAGQIDNEGIQTSLQAKLAKYEKDQGDIANAKNYLNNFINEIQAQSGQHMTVAAANLLLENANYCIAHLPVQ